MSLEVWGGLILQGLRQHSGVCFPLCGRNVTPILSERRSISSVVLENFSSERRPLRSCYSIHVGPKLAIPNLAIKHCSSDRGDEMQFLALAVDYDGTLAGHGRVTA